MVRKQALERSEKPKRKGPLSPLPFPSHPSPLFASSCLPSPSDSTTAKHRVNLFLPLRSGSVCKASNTLLPLRQPTLTPKVPTRRLQTRTPLLLKAVGILPTKINDLLRRPVTTTTGLLRQEEGTTGAAGTGATVEGMEPIEAATVEEAVVVEEVDTTTMETLEERTEGEEDEEGIEADTQVSFPSLLLLDHDLFPSPGTRHTLRESMQKRWNSLDLEAWEETARAVRLKEARSVDPVQFSQSSSKLYGSFRKLQLLSIVVSFETIFAP
jgi:hypothetical protein